MAQIQIWTRNVENTNAMGSDAPQHTFLIKVNDDGTREILRGGPENDNMIMDDIFITSGAYNDQSRDWYNPSLSNPLHYQGTTIKTSSQSEIDNLWNNAWNTAQGINAHHYDYEALTQNCNTATNLLAESMGLKSEVSDFLTQKGVWTPGFENTFSNGPFDKAYDFISGLPSSLRSDLTTINDWLSDFIKNKEYQTPQLKIKFQEKYSYTIEPGDNLSTIAHSFGTTVEALEQNNPWLQSQGRISQNGKYVLIKSGEKLSLPTSAIATSVKLKDVTIKNQNHDPVNIGGTSNDGVYTNFFFDKVNQTLLTNTKLNSQWQVSNTLVLDLNGDGVKLISAITIEIACNDNGVTDENIFYKNQILN